MVDRVSGAGAENKLGERKWENKKGGREESLFVFGPFAF